MTTQEIKPITGIRKMRTKVTQKTPLLILLCLFDIL